MGANLYISRIVLQYLGITDFGIYNVVGGIVTSFSIVSASMSAAISRFITYELGRGNWEKLNIIFSSSLIIQVFIVIIILLLGETLGLWFLSNYINIPVDRVPAAFWVFQFSLFTFSVNLLSIPYNALIIAYERMSVFAYVGIVEVSLKLLVAFCLLFSPTDRLVFYAASLFAVALIIRIIYKVYCNKHFPDSRFRFEFDKSVLYSMFGFAGWNFIGASSGVLQNQGIDILLNIFNGPVINAAKGIANQVNGAVSSFVSNFMMALNPQITKSYASGQKEYMDVLLFKGARFSFYLLLLLSLPILIGAPYILDLWLDNVPGHTVNFVRLILILALIECLSQPLITAMLATGKIRNYQIIVGGIILLNVPLSYLALKLWNWPESVFIVAILLSILALGARLLMLRKMIRLRIGAFINKVCINVVCVGFAAAMFPLIVSLYFQWGFVSFVSISCFCLISTLSSVYFIGCNREERLMINDKVRWAVDKLQRRCHDRHSR